MHESKLPEVGLAEALAVARGGPRPDLSAGAAKLLHFLLREGECTAEISQSTISVRYSWLQRYKPSGYLVRLAPGIVAQLMQLGGVARVEKEASFAVRPGTTGSGPYLTNFAKKWVRLTCLTDQIAIRIREREEDLERAEVRDLVRCPHCQEVLRSAMAKQCLRCGADWH